MPRRTQGGRVESLETREAESVGQARTFFREICQGVGYVDQERVAGPPFRPHRGLRQ